jgi:hypothetical protein
MWKVLLQYELQIRKVFWGMKEDGMILCCIIPLITADRNSFSPTKRQRTTSTSRDLDKSNNITPTEALSFKIFNILQRIFLFSLCLDDNHVIRVMNFTQGILHYFLLTQVLCYIVVFLYCEYESCMFPWFPISWVVLWNRNIM